MRATIAAVLLFGLSACAEKPLPEIQTQTVNVEVPVPCTPKIGPEPAYPDTDAILAKVPFPGAPAALLATPTNPVALSQMGQNLLYLIAHYRAGRDLRAARDAVKQAALDGCAKLPPLPVSSSPQG